MDQPSTPPSHHSASIIGSFSYQPRNSYLFATSDLLSCPPCSQSVNQSIITPGVDILVRSPPSSGPPRAPTFRPRCRKYERATLPQKRRPSGSPRDDTRQRPPVHPPRSSNASVRPKQPNSVRSSEGGKAIRVLVCVNVCVCARVVS